MFYLPIKGNTIEYYCNALDKFTSSTFQSQARLQLQLAPSLEHQVAAMLAILARYNWQQFSIVTSEIAGHDDFVQAVRDRVFLMKSQESFR